MPRLRQIDRERSVCMVQVGITHYAVAENINFIQRLIGSMRGDATLSLLQ
jgi:hypothetical protein